MNPSYRIEKKLFGGTCLYVLGPYLLLEASTDSSGRPCFLSLPRTAARPCTPLYCLLRVSWSLSCNNRQARSRNGWNCHALLSLPLQRRKWPANNILCRSKRLLTVLRASRASGSTAVAVLEVTINRMPLSSQKRCRCFTDGCDAFSMVSKCVVSCLQMSCVCKKAGNVLESFHVLVCWRCAAPVPRRPTQVFLGD